VDACTVTASDVIAAFATSGPNLLLAKPVGFFGSERLANHFGLAITQLTSEWQRLIEANPFGRRYRPDIGYVPAACSCERACNLDACTVSACYMITAFAVSNPSLPLAEPAGFFGSERRLNCFTRRITQPTSDQLLLISTVLSAINVCDPKSEMLIVNTQELCNGANIFRGCRMHRSRIYSGWDRSGCESFPDIHSNFHNSRVQTQSCTDVFRPKFNS
jgi:hypothetical protein